MDTNIFLELAFEDTRWKECRDFLSRIEEGKISASTSDFALYGSILQIESKTRSGNKVHTFIKSLLTLQGLSILRPSEEEILKATRIMASHKLDFDDSLVVSSMLANRLTSLVSFDRHFDRVKEIERLEPANVLTSPKR
ncbi:MAG: type II toxin-antitoxin system VapC family toxin [Nitrososphaerales archaeon]